ncbi:MAG TPA: hypothetical protein VGP44_05170 [Gemmatimonadales bacterium]|nr:hypothetical protein [Rubrobacteraceae bacterium]HEV8177060.1 hypothetical protein [Gemmatimonadales bacterium]
MTDRKALRRAVKRAQVALNALTANGPDTPPVHRKRLEDSIALVKAVADDLRRELGDPPSAAERRNQ